MAVRILKNAHAISNLINNHIYYRYNKHLINPTYDRKLHEADDKMIAIQPRT